MALEGGTWVDDLVTSNPVGASDDVNQGDDHLRLVKSVLKNTFPNAVRAFRFETVLTKTAAYTVLAADARALLMADVSGGAFTVTLPLGSSVFAGFSLIVNKSDSSANVVTVDGNGAETINGAATRSLTLQFQAEKYVWDGTEWKVTTSSGQLLDGSVTAAKLATDAVTTVKILDANVTTAKLASNAVTTAKITNANVTLAKLANIATDRLLGRETAGAGVPEELTVGSGLSLAGGALVVPANGINGTHIAMGSDAQGDVMFYDGTNWVRLAAGVADLFLQTKGAGVNPLWAAISAGFTRGTPVATTTGAAQGFTGLSSGLDVIIFMLDGVSDATDDLIIRLGDSGGYETTGYLSVVESVGVQETFNTGFQITKNTSSGSAGYSGFITFERVDGNTWLSGGNLIGPGTAETCKSSGTKTLSGALDRIQIITVLGSNFTNGQVNILTM